MGWIEDMETGEVLGERYEREEVFRKRGKYADPYSEPFYRPFSRPRVTDAQVLHNRALVEMESVKMALRHGAIEKAYQWMGRYAELMKAARRLDCREVTDKPGGEA